MLRLLRHISLALLILAPSGMAMAADVVSGYVAGVDDLPLMSGLSEVPNSSTVFDKPDGRIVEAYAAGVGIKPGAIADFYRAALPQLGWKQGSDLIFVRENEQLQLTISEEGARVTVRFDIAPR